MKESAENQMSFLVNKQKKREKYLGKASEINTANTSKFYWIWNDDDHLLFRDAHSKKSKMDEKKRRSKKKISKLI